MPDLTGQSIGRYHIIAPLGEGGMATVYKGFDTRLECEVAIKFIRRGQIGSDHMQKMLMRFEREAKRMARFTHPNIVKVIDYGEYQGNPYLVMEYLPGGTLKDLLKVRHGKPLPYQEAARILAPVANALEYAHQQGTIHRDVKPANILITAGGAPMLADFGVAKILDIDIGQSLTSTGMGIGTPKYMAPEQWLNQISVQTDIYALGVVFYEMVTGRVPYNADTPAAVMLKQNSEPLPRPRQFAPDLPLEVEQVIYKALARKAEYRYADMGTLVGILEKLAQGIPYTAPPLQADERDAETLDYGSPPQPLPQARPAPVRESPPSPVQSILEQSVWSPSQPVDPLPPASPVKSNLSTIRPYFIMGIIGVVMGGLVVVIGVLGWIVYRPTQPSSEMQAQTTAAFAQETLPVIGKQTPTISINENGQGEGGAVSTQTPVITVLPTLTPTLLAEVTQISEKGEMEQVNVPAGEFLMGSTQADVNAALKECGSNCGKDSFDAEKPQHKVYLDQYWIDKTEVTNAMFAKFVKTSRYKTAAEKEGWGYV